MDLLRFDLLEDAATFERLCADILVAEGCLNVRGLGSGPDQGTDLLLDVPCQTPLINETVPYVVQCKWFSGDNTVGESAIGDVLGYLALHRAKGLLLITSSRFSGTAVTKANAMDRDPANPHHILLWDAAELSRRVRRHPDIIARYWYASSETPTPITPTPDRFPKYDFTTFLESFAPPPRYESVTMETFPHTEANLANVKALSAFAERYQNASSVVTIVRGEIGSGKTGFAYSLINKCRQRGATVAGLNDTEYLSIFLRYEAAGDERLPQLLACFQEVDYLLLDDFGFNLSDQIKPQRAAAETLVQIVRNRIEANRPTVITTYDNHRSTVVADYVSFLKERYPVLDCGETSVRVKGNEWFREQYGIDLSPSKPDGASTDQNEHSMFAGVWLTRGWIGEKLEKIEGKIKNAIAILRTPIEDFENSQRGYTAEMGYSQTRDAAAVGTLTESLSSLKGYRHHIEALPWDAIVFSATGPRLIDRSSQAEDPWNNDHDNRDDT